MKVVLIIAQGKLAKQIWIRIELVAYFAFNMNPMTIIG